MSFTGEDVSFVWNNDSMKAINPFIPKRLDDRYQIDTRVFVVRVRVQGSNVEPLETAIRLENWFPAFRFLGEGEVPSYWSKS